MELPPRANRQHPSNTALLASPSSIIHTRTTSNTLPLDEDSLRSQSTDLAQQGLELVARPEGLQIRVAADVLALEKNVGDGALASDVLKGVLECTTVGCLLLAGRTRRNLRWRDLMR